MAAAEDGGWFMHRFWRPRDKAWCGPFLAVMRDPTLLDSHSGAATRKVGASRFGVTPDAGTCPARQDT